MKGNASMIPLAVQAQLLPVSMSEPIYDVCTHRQTQAYQEQTGEGMLSWRFGLTSICTTIAQGSNASHV
jgi:hypothetical protein